MTRLKLGSSGFARLHRIARTIVALALCFTVFALEAFGQEGPRVDPLATPIWAIRAALADAQQLPADLATRSRYVWLRGGSRDELARLAFVVNASLSRVNIGVLPGNSAGAVPFAGGKLVRLDLGVLATDLDDFANLVTTWDRLAETERDFTASITETRIVTVKPFRHANGKTYTRKRQTITVRGPAAHVATEWVALAAALGSTECPIIDLRELQRAALGTRNGGLYYDFRGIRPNATLKEYLASRGASEGQVESLESLEKAVIAFSGVTGKERMVSLFRGAGVRASMGGGLVALTFDPFDEDRDADGAPLRNLLNFRGRGSEVILELANGYHEFTLWNAAGKLVRVVPQQLAMDSTIPHPFTQNLEPAISCIACHAQGGGWRGFENDVPKILSAGVDIFGDLSSPVDQAKQAQLLAGLYTGPSWFTVGTGPFAVGRLTYSAATLRTTGQDVETVSANLIAARDAYEYTLLDSWAVAAELGISGLTASDGKPDTDADAVAATAELAEFIGALPAADGSIAREDAIIGVICAGIPVNRTSFDTVRHLLYERAYSRGLK
jgi:hypothetical protein